MSFTPPISPIVSTANSTTTPLTSSATFTGVWEDCWTYASISVIAKTDVPGTLWLDFSTDGSNTDREIQLSEGTDGNLGIHSLTPIAKYYRIKLHFILSQVIL